MHPNRPLSARKCRLCGKPKGCFAFAARTVDDIADQAGIKLKGTAGYAHPECLSRAQRIIDKL